MRVFIGVDVGATKTQTLAVNDEGDVLGMVTGGPGATYTVGYDAFAKVVDAGISALLQKNGATKSDVVAAGFGVSGLDWPQDLPPTVEALNRLGLTGALSIHNDGDLPLAAGTTASWGIAISAGTGNIVTGMDRQGRYARSTGGSMHCGELGGAMELVEIAIQAVAFDYIRRGPPTKITELMVAETHSRDVLDLLSRVVPGHVQVAPSFALQIIEAALEGDAVAVELLQRSGRDLALTALGIARQLDLQVGPFEVVLSGSMFKGMQPFFAVPLKETILAEAPGARFIPLETLPVVGGVILAMKKVGFDFAACRARILQSLEALKPD
jgi:N-acetylglucosamine kinase-like BadF-type ATPase